MALIGLFAKLVKRYGIEPTLDQEAELAARDDVVHAVASSPVRFDIIGEAFARNGRPPFTPRTLPHNLGSMRGIIRSLRELDRNPPQPSTCISPDKLADLERFAQSQGVGAVGYARVPHHLVFQEKAILFDKAIVLVMEMDKDLIAQAPGPPAAEAVHATYHHLGDAANAIAGYLRERGYAAHAGHPLNGMALYPPLGQLAGLGWRGRHGMLISPEYGPCMRLAAVFTSIENLPYFEGPSPHAWVESFCATCGRCIRECPTEAILETPIPHENGLVTCSDVEKCFPYFVTHYGCSVCIKVCPFNHVGYEKLKR